jgi:hypothetical protein
METGNNKQDTTATDERPQQRRHTPQLAKEQITKSYKSCSDPSSRMP